VSVDLSRKTMGFRSVLNQNTLCVDVDRLCDVKSFLLICLVPNFVNYYILSPWECEGIGWNNHFYKSIEFLKILNSFLSFCLLDAFFQYSASKSFVRHASYFTEVRLRLMSESGYSNAVCGIFLLVFVLTIVSSNVGPFCPFPNKF